MDIRHDNGCYIGNFLSAFFPHLWSFTHFDKLRKYREIYDRPLKRRVGEKTHTLHVLQSRKTHI